MFTRDRDRSRGSADESHSPFPFERLPAELRNEIYKLVASSQNFFYLTNYHHYFKEIGDPMRVHTEGTSCYNAFMAISHQSNLFRVSQQTHAEGLALFYQHHHFQLFAERVGCFLAILRWLDNIGSTGRSNIRHIQFNYKTQSNWLVFQFLSALSDKLSDRATIVHKSSNPQLLWKIARRYRYFHSGTAPSFQISGYRRGGVAFQDTFHDYGRNPDWQSYDNCLWLAGSMTFCPRPS